MIAITNIEWKDDTALPTSLIITKKDWFSYVGTQGVGLKDMDNAVTDYLTDTFGAVKHWEYL